MGYKVIWTDEAITELRGLVAFISNDNPTAAIKLGETLIQKSMILSEHPRLGRMLRKSPTDSFRELVIPPYRLIYQIDDKRLAIYVRLLWHGARQEPKIQ
jgi:addiction module RelE/StbE family toxin